MARAKWFVLPHCIPFITKLERQKGNIIFSAELARRYGDQGIVSTALNPGGIKTELARHEGSFTQMIYVCHSYIIPVESKSELYL